MIMSRAVLNSIENSAIERLNVEQWCEDYRAKIHAKMAELTQDAGPFQRDVDYVLGQPGKHFRGLITLASGMLNSESSEPSDNLLVAAAAIELFHEASLIHDDIVDRSLIRRGHPSLAAKTTIKNAANVGSFLIGRGLSQLSSMCVDDDIADHYAVMQHLAQAQILDSLPPAASFIEHRDRLLRITDGKTVSLFMFATRIGLSQSNGDAASRRTTQCILDNFAVGLGRAFQIRDDILDIINPASLKRPDCNDLVQKKLSWPLLFWAGKSTDWQASINHFLSTASVATAVHQLKEEIIGCGAITESTRLMAAESNKARASIASLPSSTGKRVLLCLLNKVTIE